MRKEKGKCKSKSFFCQSCGNTLDEIKYFIFSVSLNEDLAVCKMCMRRLICDDNYLLKSKIDKGHNARYWVRLPVYGKGYTGEG